MPDTRRPVARARTFTLSVRTSAGAIEVTVERKRVRNLNLRVRSNGTVRMSIPLRATAADAQAFLDRRASWIEQHVARRQERATAPDQALYDEDRGTIPLWGALVVLTDALAQVGIAATEDELADAGTRDALIDRLYHLETTRAVEELADETQQRVGVSVASWRIRTMTSRWGSCTPHRRTIRINAMLAAWPPCCLEMVVMHELVHLIESGHTARFHALLDACCPHNRSSAALLKEPARVVALRGGEDGGSTR